VSAEVFGKEPSGATPLSDEDYRDLKPLWVRNRQDLNLAEAMNVNRAQNFFLETKLTTERLLDDLTLRDMHSRMFGEVWTWAGKYRTRDLNIGLSYLHVAEAVRNLMDDAKLWHSKPLEDRAELEACELHHRLVVIHPFLNGNGRLARLFTDVLLISQRKPRFTWGSASGLTPQEQRRRYIYALQAADRGEIEYLRTFVRT